MPELQSIAPQPRDLGGGFVVRRLLPSPLRASIGPFVFFDHFGPVVAGPSEQHDVRPHPHIGLATVTYLFDGAIMHRDSLGAVQRIEPGAVNLMIAGRGIVHSERTPDDLRGVTRTSHGLQSWLALPPDSEEVEPSFTHTPAQAIPRVEHGGASVQVLIGEAFGATSPVATLSPTLYLELALARGASLTVPGAARERALYGVDAPFTLDGTSVEPHRMVVLAEGATPRLAVAADAPARLVLIGGEPLGHRFVWWNFVHSRRERITQAADDWQAGRFATVPGDDREFISLPARATG